MIVYEWIHRGETKQGALTSLRFILHIRINKRVMSNAIY